MCGDQTSLLAFLLVCAFHALLIVRIEIIANLQRIQQSKYCDYGHIEGIFFLIHCGNRSSIGVFVAL